MAFLGETFDAQSLPESEAYELLPAGWYSAKITEAGLRETRAGTGQYVRLRFDVIGPSHQGRVLFANITIRHQNIKAEEIGRRQLGELIRAIGLARVSDSDELVGHAIQIKVSVRPETYEYPASNEVRGFKAAPAARPARFDPEPAPAADKPLPPWAKR